MQNRSDHTVGNFPLLVRVVPFIAFVLLTACQGQFGEGSRYWMYALKTLLGAGIVLTVWRHIPEMRWKVSWDAIAVGVLVFVLWVGMDGFYPPIEVLLKKVLCPVFSSMGLGTWCSAPVKLGAPWNPHSEYGMGLAWAFAMIRLLGSTIVVPPIEEAFYRSFLYRYLQKPEFETVSLSQLSWKPFLLTGAIFGLAHFEWLPGILCGFLYQFLVIRHGRLGEAMTAHATTNFLLGLWVIWRGAWHFW